MQGRAHSVHAKVRDNGGGEALRFHKKMRHRTEGTEYTEPTTCGNCYGVGNRRRHAGEQRCMVCPDISECSPRQ